MEKSHRGPLTFFKICARNSESDFVCFVLSRSETLLNLPPPDRMFVIVDA